MSDGLTPTSFAEIIRKRLKCVTDKIKVVQEEHTVMKSINQAFKQQKVVLLCRFS